MYGASQGKIGQHDDRVCLEVRAEFFSCTRRASVVFLKRVYRVSASYRDFLKKNTGLYFRFSSSLNKDALIETSETAR